MTARFSLTLDEALRAGVIARGMDIEEEDARRSEDMASDVRRKVLVSGDEKLIRILKVLPDESWSRLQDILAGA